MFQTQVEWKKKQLNLTNEILTTVYVMRVEKKSTSEISKAIKKLTINDKVVLPISTKVIKDVMRKDIEEIPKYYMSALPNFFHAINEEDKKIRGKFKKKQLQKLMERAKFVVCSKHTQDCAIDHEDWQGHIYYNERFKNLPRVRKLINQNGYKSMQWVTGKPVYLITRPYCRHYFEEVTIEEVEKGTYQTPTRQYGNYTYQNPGGNLSFYKQRLKLFEEMYKKHPTEDLRILINKTRVIVKRWELYNKYGK